MIIGWLLIALAESFSDRNPRRFVRADPIFTPAVITSLIISASISAASIGLEYLAAKKQKAAPVDRGKQDDIRISLPGYGESIVWSRGIVRGAPVWFWHTPAVDRPVVTPGHSGGKGGPHPPSPTITDHQYYKSVAGVFHDGEIKTVRRIWFNQDLVWNLVDLSPVRYEAESATLGGTATITSASYASNGAGVTHLGTGGGDNGYVDFAVTVPSDGDYDIAIGYQLDSGSMSFEVLLDGVSQGSVACEGSGSGLIGIQTIGFSMTAGAHTIRLGNTSSHAPNLDYIDVVETVVFSGGTIADNRTFTGLLDPSAKAPTDETKAWAYYNAQPLELDEGGDPIPGTSTISATLSKWGNPQIRIYRGTADQDPDPSIVADKGAGNVPAWRGYAYIVIQDIQLANGALPNVTIEWDQGVNEVDQITKDLYALGGVDDSDLNVTALSGLTITGVIRTSQKPIGDTLKDLQTRFQFDMVELDGGVTSVLRSRTGPDLTIPRSKLRAYADGSEMPAQDAVIKDMDLRDLPYEVQVNALDPGNDYHNGMQSDFRASGPQLQPVSVSLALVMDKHEMKQLASTLLYKPDMEGREIEIFTGPEFIKAVTGTIIDIQLANATHRIRVADAKYSLPAGICNFQTVRHAPSLYSPTGFGSTSGRERPIAGFPSNTKAVILDGPLFRPEDAGDGTQPVWYIGLCGVGGGTWPGAFIYQESPKESGNYIFVNASDKPSGIGQTTGALASVSDTTVWDTTSSLTVNFYFDPQLSTASTEAVEDNPNLNLIAIKNPSTGDVECVQFKNATPGIAPSPFVAQYTLDNFLRGRFDTQGNVGSHSSADDVVVVDSTLKVQRERAEDIGQTLNLKFVTSGQSADNVLATPEVLRGYSLRPSTPENLTLINITNGDRPLTWQPNPKNAFQRERYIIRVRDSSTNVLKRTATVSVGDHSLPAKWTYAGGSGDQSKVTIGSDGSISAVPSTGDQVYYDSQVFYGNGDVEFEVDDRLIFNLALMNDGTFDAPAHVDSSYSRGAGLAYVQFVDVDATSAWRRRLHAGAKITLRIRNHTIEYRYDDTFWAFAGLLAPPPASTFFLRAYLMSTPADAPLNEAQAYLKVRFLPSDPRQWVYTDGMAKEDFSGSNPATVKFEVTQISASGIESLPATATG